MKEREGVAVANAQLHDQVKAARVEAVGLEARAEAAEGCAKELQARLDYVTVREGSGLRSKEVGGCSET